MNKLCLSTIVGWFLIFLGLFSILGWILKIKWLVAPIPGFAEIVFNTALCFFLCGFVLIFSDKISSRLKITSMSLSLLVSIFAAVILSQNLFNFNIGLDQFFVKADMFDQNTHPGRMGNNAALAFIFSGMALFLSHFSHNKIINFIIQISAYVILIIGLSSLLGYLLNLDALYSWRNTSYLSMQSAFGISLLGIAIWKLSEKATSKDVPEHQEKNLLILSMIVLIGIAIIAFTIATSIFVNQQNQFYLNFLSRTVPTILLSVIIVMLLLYWQIFPLIQKSIISEKELLIINQRLQESENQLRAMAYQDSLTGLANRSRFEQFIIHAIQSSRRQKVALALVFLDLDHFKNINDTIGHEAGDMLLKEIGVRLKKTLRSTDLVARLGGDEFVLVITDVKQTDSVAIIAQKILENITKPIKIQNKELYITTSMGISLYPYDGEVLQKLLQSADLALYRAKDQGRNNFQFCTPEMTARAQEKMAKQNALAFALRNNEFDLYFQPKFNMKQNRITGVESLIRWHSNKFNSSPREIILLAEETGLINPLGDWILKSSFEQAKYFQEISGNLTFNMAVNISQRQLKQVNLVENIKEQLGVAGFSPHLVELEITENFLMKFPENTLKILKDLKDLGLQIVIDDFGTGNSSLNFLRRFAVDKIKIDNIFIRQMKLDQTAAEIISAIIAMANKLDIKTIAEGVETKEQYEFLLNEGCSELQGYYLCQPLPKDKLSKFLLNPVHASPLLQDLRNESSPN